jgi:hypothetical protein
MLTSKVNAPVHGAETGFGDLAGHRFNEHRFNERLASRSGGSMVLDAEDTVRLQRPMARV